MTSVADVGPSRRRLSRAACWDAMSSALVRPLTDATGLRDPLLAQIEISVPD